MGVCVFYLLAGFKSKLKVGMKKLLLAINFTVRLMNNLQGSGKGDSVEGGGRGGR